MIFQNSATAVLVGFAFGASLIALFMRVGGGIFTKAADVGADLVGKIEAGIPEDDPRNAATIADNVGDNVGDCAGMAADLFESYEITIIAALILGWTAFTPVDQERAVPAHRSRRSASSPRSSGSGRSRARANERNALSPINRGFWTASFLTVVGAFFVAQFYVHNLKLFWAVLTGVGLSLAASLITEHFTSTERNPVKEIAESARTGPATTVLAGFAIGLESSVWAIIAIAIAIGVAIGLGGAQHPRRLLPGLAHRDRAAVDGGHGRLRGQLRPGVGQLGGDRRDGGRVRGRAPGRARQPRRRRQHDQGDHQGRGDRLGGDRGGRDLRVVHPDRRRPAALPVCDACSKAIQINVANPKTFIGLLIGGSVAFLFSSLAIRAVGRSAGTVVQEVRRQFRDHPGIMDYSEKPEYGRVISICTAAAQRELATPALLAVLTPVIVGFGIGYLALGAFLAAAILTGQLMANTLSNSGGAWDNAKKYIEDGHEGGKGSEAHMAAVIGDTVGDPFKDTAGPALNPLIKVMNLVSLLILPAVITQAHHTAVRYTISGVSLAVLLVRDRVLEAQGGVDGRRRPRDGHDTAPATLPATARPDRCLGCRGTDPSTRAARTWRARRDERERTGHR